MTIRACALRHFFAVSLLALAPCVHAQSASEDIKKYLPTVSATLRARAELSTETGEGRFQVRNARLSLKGSVTDWLGYTLQADFCDRGSFRMLDAYATLRPDSHWQLMLGQMRVPLSADATRSVRDYWFANRSLVARDLWTSRRAGIKARYTLGRAYLEGGIFNNASTSAQTSWSKDYTYSIIGVLSAGRWRPELGFMSKDLGTERANIWNASLSWSCGQWQAEAEGVLKFYSGGEDATRAINLMGRRFFNLNWRMANRLSVELRYDASSANYEVEEENYEVQRTKRHRITAGVTLAYLQGPVNAHLRLNYEQYFHAAAHTRTAADGNKLCLELMLYF